MKISFIIPTIHQYDLLFLDCLPALRAYLTPGDDVEIIVVEDGSEKELRKKIESQCKKEKIIYLEHEVNQGFSKAVNTGLRHATGDILVLLNNDVKCLHNITEPLREAFQADEDIGIVGALLLFPTGKIQHAGIFPSSPTHFVHSGGSKTLTEYPEALRSKFLVAVTGALFAIRRECLNEIGLFDERYFLACEDTQYCLRAWEAGWRVFYDPKVKAIHVEGQTRGAGDEDKKKNHPAWFKKEIETQAIFKADIQSRFLPLWDDLQKNIRELNIPKAPQGPYLCDVKWFGTHNDAQVIVRRDGALGDVILTTGIVRELKKVFQDRDIIVSTKCGDVYLNNPYISKVISPEETPTENLIDLNGAYEKTPKMHILEAYRKAAHLNGASIRPELYSTAADLASLKKKMGAKFSASHKRVILHPAVSWASRTIPLPIWTSTAKILVERGFTVISIGREGDHSLGSIPTLQEYKDLSIFELRELFKISDAFIGPDSGPLHVAQTTNIPIVGIFTVANPDYRLIERHAKTIALIPKVFCRFCLHEEKPPVTSVTCRYKTNHCLHSFDTTSIVKALYDATSALPSSS